MSYHTLYLAPYKLTVEGAICVEATGLEYPSPYVPGTAPVGVPYVFTLNPPPSIQVAGGHQASKVVVSEDGQYVYFTLFSDGQKANAGEAKVSVTNADGTVLSSDTGLEFATDFVATLYGVEKGLEFACDQSALLAVQSSTHQLQIFVENIWAAVDVYEQILAVLLKRVQTSTVASEIDAWKKHLLGRATSFANAVNRQGQRLHQPHPLCVLDGQPYVGSDEEPHVDTGACVLFCTATGNVVIPSTIAIDV
jgi:hypothetical protein